MRRPNLILALVLIASGPLRAQSEPPRLSPTRAQILLLGVFHFRDSGLDEFKPRHDVDILSPERQAEVAEVVDLLAAFAPTKVAVERRQRHRERIDRDYRSYRAGELELGPEEVHQLGFRLAAALDHDRVYPVDAEARHYEPYVDPTTYARDRAQGEALSPLRHMEYERLARFGDELKTRQPLRDHLLHLNDPQRLLQSHGIYLVGSFKAGVGDEYPGVDAKTAWYNRNLRIFANLQRITERDGERIVVIIGAGHVPILRHAVLASPEYELIEVADLLARDR